MRALATDGLRNFRFLVGIVPLPNMSPTIGKLGFMTASGFGIQNEVIPYREGGDNSTTRKVPGQTDFGPITLSRGSMAAPQGPLGVGINAGTNETWNWLQAIFSVMEGQGTSNPGDDFRTDVYIDVLEHPVTSGVSAAGINSTPAIKLRVHVYNAWPMGWNLGDLDAGGEGMLLESLQLAHEGFRCIYATNTAGDFVSSSAQ